MKRTASSLIARLLPDGEAKCVRIVLTNADETMLLTCDTTLVVVRVWQEDEETVRVSIRHPSSGTEAMLQGNAALTVLAHRLRISTRPASAEP